MKSVPDAEWNCELDYRLIKQVRPSTGTASQRLMNRWHPCANLIRLIATSRCGISRVHPAALGGNYMPFSLNDIHSVGEILAFAARTEIMPRFRQLTPAQVR